jgi:hypothetical protein
MLWLLLKPTATCPVLCCAALPQVRCPVNINTGDFTKQLRTAAIEGLDAAAGAASASTSSSWGSKLSLFAANHFTLISRGAPTLLNTVDFFHGCVHLPVVGMRAVCLPRCGLLVAVS